MTAECSGQCGAQLTRDACILISICGHISCAACLKKAGRSACPEKSCKAWVAKTHQKAFGVLDPAAHAASAEPPIASVAVETHAQKLEMVTRLLLENPSDQAVMFVQDAAQFKGIEAAFCAKSITYAVISTDAEAATIEAFKTAGAAKMQVLVLEITKEYAAGTNLFNANHIIFLSPFFTTSEDDYAEKKLQAVRRVFRQGQEKPVFIHNFVSLRILHLFTGFS
jgi:SNF2 family DNA or RNA helicase